MQQVSFAIGPCGPAFRYALLARARACADARGVSLLGFRLDADATLLLEGHGDAVKAAVTAIKVGAARSGEGPRRLGPSRWSGWSDPMDALVALHATPGADGPLADPWSSHRDLMGLRQARFYDRRVWAGRIDPRLVHLRAGGGELPFGWPPALDAHPRDLGLLLRVAGAVLGVLPADRACFRLFAHLTRALGVPRLDAAAALTLTPRRVRQLLAEPEPHLRLALLTAGDARLRIVP